MLELLQFEFMRNALMAGLLASIICGIIGTLVVVNRIVFLSGGIAHASYGGIGLSFYMGWPVMAGTLGFSITSAIVMAAVTLRARHRADTIIGVIWAVGMACGIILTDLTPGYNTDLMSYLFGSILTVPTQSLWAMLILGAVILGMAAYFYQDLLALSYDEEFARIRGIPVTRLYFMLMIMLAVTIVLVIQVVGLILVIALLTIPPFIMEKHVGSMKQMMAGSSLLGTLFTTLGLYLSSRYDLTSGASIILVAGTFFFISLIWEQIRTRRKKIIT